MMPNVGAFKRIQTGLAVDGWTESVPQLSTTIGKAFNVEFFVFTAWNVQVITACASSLPY